MKLNIGCGHAKLPDFINIDADKDLKPDLVLDVANVSFPYEDESVEEVTCFHTIEHIARERHPFVIGEINRVLKYQASLTLAFPDAARILNNFLDNKWGLRDYWEKTVLGRGLTLWDCHRALIHTDDFIPFLREMGFASMKVMEEVGQGHNTVIYAKKSFKVVERTDLLRRELNLEMETASGT